MANKRNLDFLNNLMNQPPARVLQNQPIFIDLLIYPLTQIKQGETIVSPFSWVNKNYLTGKPA